MEITRGQGGEVEGPSKDNFVWCLWSCTNESRQSFWGGRKKEKKGQKRGWFSGGF